MAETKRNKDGNETIETAYSQVSDPSSTNQVQGGFATQNPKFKGPSWKLRIQDSQAQKRILTQSQVELTPGYVNYVPEMFK